jgi:hypothetical protein
MSRVFPNIILILIRLAGPEGYRKRTGSVLRAVGLVPGTGGARIAAAAGIARAVEME